MGIKCSRCGGELSELDKFCPSCGAKIENEKELSSLEVEQMERKEKNQRVTFGVLATSFGALGLIISFVTLPNFIYPFLGMMVMFLGFIPIVMATCGITGLIFSGLAKSKGSNKAFWISGMVTSSLTIVALVLYIFAATVFLVLSIAGINIFW